MLPARLDELTWHRCGGAGGARPSPAAACTSTASTPVPAQTYGPGRALEFRSDLRRRLLPARRLHRQLQQRAGRCSARGTAPTRSTRAPTTPTSQTDTQLPEPGRHLPPLPDRVGRDRGPLLRRRPPGRHPRRHLRRRTRCAARQRLHSRRPRDLGRLAADEPLPGRGHASARASSMPGQSANWGALTWTAAIPAGTSVAMSVRTGNTPTPDGSWSAFTPVASSRRSTSPATPATSSTGPSSSDERRGQDADPERGLDRATRPAPTLTPPTITERSPAPNATGVAAEHQRRGPVQRADGRRHDRRVERPTARPGRRQRHPGDVTYSGATATLDPDADLAPEHHLRGHRRRDVEDSNGNSLGADDTWSFTTAAPSAASPTPPVTEFGAGTTGADTYVSETGDGEVTLKPTVGAEFSADRAAGRLVELHLGVPGGGAGGSATVSGSACTSTAPAPDRAPTYGPGHALEFVATFGGRDLPARRLLGQFQHASARSSAPRTAAANSTRAPTSAAARPRPRCRRSAARLLAPLPDRVGRGPGPLLRRRGLVATHSVTFAAADARRSPATSTPAAPSSTVDWLRMSPYPASGTFDSRILDAGQHGRLGRARAGARTRPPAPASRSASAPATRRPRTAAGRSFTPIAISGGDIPGTSRYLQYRAELATGDVDLTPVLSEVTVGYAAASPRSPTPAITATDPASPANNNSPVVKGTLPAAGRSATSGSTPNGTCNGAPALKRPAAKFTSTGITTPVPDDSTTTFTATVSTTATISACSDPFTYVEDSTAPRDDDRLRPLGLDQRRDPDLRLLLGARRELRMPLRLGLRSDPARAPAAPTPPPTTSPAAPHVFEVRATDPARQHRRDPGEPELHGRRGRPAASIEAGDHRHRPGEPGQRQQPPREGNAAEQRDARRRPDLHERRLQRSGGAEAAGGEVHQHRDPDPGRRRLDDDVDGDRRHRRNDLRLLGSLHLRRGFDRSRDDDRLRPLGLDHRRDPDLRLPPRSPARASNAASTRLPFGPCSGPGSSHTPAKDLPAAPTSSRSGPQIRPQNTDADPGEPELHGRRGRPAGRSEAGDHRHQPGEPGQQQQPPRQGNAAEQRDARRRPDLHNGSCNGAAALKRPAAKFTSTGIPTPVPDNSTTTLTATVVIDGTISACSDPFTYGPRIDASLEAIDAGPSGSTTDATQCRFDAAGTRCIRNFRGIVFVMALPMARRAGSRP